MKDELIYCCKLRDESPTPEVTAELLTAMEYDFSTWQDRLETIAFHTLYFENQAEAEEAAEKIKSLLETWDSLEVKITAVENFTMKKEDWAEAWKKYFNVLHISERLIVKPSWLDYNAASRQTVVEIDPGMSFGTGQHATTAYCLKMIDKLSCITGTDSFLDAGCGSGILSIAAAKLGFKKIDAFDIDPEAVRIAAENLEKNSIAKEQVIPQVSDVAKFKPISGGYDLVAANILGHILCKNSEHIISFVKPGGKLILAGILSEDFEETATEFCEKGMRLQDSFTEKEWTSGLFEKA
ncbi:50S ribosomal protein L11 methyltransferase [Lentisphaerota bacterium ZTH]|nr:50S ribosomal protein L11 methyltransferase [Lentisphaerota bacterium]WET06930.1 50S ribosomal protein L11 methyltransferase [Lentisphaerota bacterium ZTH]